MELWQRFTPRARRAVLRAHNEATRWHTPLVGPEHLLIGLLHVEDGNAYRFLAAGGAALDALLGESERYVEQEQGTEDTPTELFFTPAAQSVLQSAYTESRTAGSSHVGTEHILLGLLRGQEGFVAELLARHNVDTPTLRSMVTQMTQTETQTQVVEPAAPSLRVFISADMEGISGVGRSGMTESEHRDYGRAREFMTADVNAAVQGAFDAGATEVWVKDSHGPADNILIEKLDPRAHLIQGWTAGSRMMEGIDDTFDAAVLVGYHSRSMTPDGVISHTMLFRVRRLWYNDVEVGESGISAAHAGHFGVPLVFVSGCEALGREIAQVLGPEVETVAVKQAYTRECARLYPVEACREQIRAGVARAVAHRKQIPAFVPTGPISCRMELARVEQAEAAALVPGVEIIEPGTVGFTAANGLEAADIVALLLETTGA